MHYHAVFVTARGGPENLQIVENELQPPANDEVRLKILAASVTLPDVQARYGHSPFAPQTPFVPGYAVVGRIDAIGEAVEAPLAVGAEMAALTVYGGYAEYIDLDPGQLIPVPAGLDPAEAAVLVLNYLVAYQSMHRTAKVQPGEKALIIGASGGIGTAFLQLGQLAGLQMYGLASQRKHHILTAYGATAIDYHTQDFVQVIQQTEPEGLEVVFDGMGGDYYRRSFSLLKRGGRLVGYGNPLSFANMLKLLGQMVWFNLLPNGRSARYYGTGSSRFNRQPFLEDWAALFRLLREGKIKPVIHQKFPVLQARQANEVLESGEVVGNVVLVAPELL